MVAVVGQIMKVDHADTKTTIYLEDNSGSIEAVRWNDENTDSQEDQVAQGIVEGNNVRVIGSVRAQQDKRYLMVFKVGLAYFFGSFEIFCHYQRIVPK